MSPTPPGDPHLCDEGAGACRSGAVAAVVLAAGASARMGRPKPLLPLGDRTYLENILTMLASTPIRTVVVVLGCGHEKILQAITWGAAVPVFNPHWRRGMLSSLQVGLRALTRLESRQQNGLEAALMSLVDMPRIHRDTVMALLQARQRSGAPILVPAHAGRRGHPVLFARCLWPELLTTDAAGGAAVIVRRHETDLQVVDVDDPWILCDADTPVQHRRLADAG